MAFREIDRPDSSKILELPEEAGPALIVAPPLGVFKDELAFWRSRKKEADRAGDVAARRIAEESMGLLRKAAMGRAGVELMLQQNVYDAEAVGSWFMSSVLATSHSRMMREIDQIDTRGKLPVLGYNPDIGFAVDFYSRDPYRSGVHATSEHMRNYWDIEPPVQDEVRYYEGDAIFLRATTPAQPTAVFPRDFRSHYGQDFDPKQYVSIVPRLKTEFWTPNQ